MKKHDKAWSLYVFSSAHAIRSYRIEELVGLGVTWVWMGLEGKDSQYTKLHGTDAPGLVRRLQAHGIRVLGSTIIGLENHTPENIDEVIDYAAHYATVFHQFMLYTPLPGTPLFRDLTSQGRMKDESECELADIHGQYIMNYRHPHIPSGMESELLLRAFQRDLEVNGPSVVRNVRTLLAGWKRYKDHPDSRIRRHYAYESRELSGTYSALVAATRMYYRGNVEMQARLDLLLKDLHHEFGWKSRFYSALGGPYRTVEDPSRGRSTGAAGPMSHPRSTSRMKRPSGLLRPMVPRPCSAARLPSSPIRSDLPWRGPPPSRSP